jgi:hypothetical protein
MAKRLTFAGPKPEKAAKQPKPKKPTKAKAAKGRGKYDPKMCKRVVALGKQGKSKAQFRRDLGIHHKTWANWMQKHEEFREAATEAYELSLAYWEDVGQAGVHLGNRFNTLAYTPTRTAKSASARLSPRSPGAPATRSRPSSTTPRCRAPIPSMCGRASRLYWRASPAMAPRW